MRPTFRALRRISPPDPPEHILELSVCAEALIDASEERLNIALLIVRQIQIKIVITGKRVLSK